MATKRRGPDNPCRVIRQKRGRKLLLRPSLLMMLMEQPAHGYVLSEQLMDQGIIPEHLDSSVIYRELRDLDEKGWIDSYWDEDSKGPRRRVYQINPRGEECLEIWISVLERVGNQINSLLERYRSMTAG